MTITRRQITTAVLLAAGGALPLLGRAAGYPDRPITFVAPFAPGSTTDAVARILVQHMAQNLGQPGVIENKVGAGGTIGMGSAARSKPDGYTMVFTGMSAHVLAPLTLDNVPYDPLTSFAPVGQVASVPLAMVINPALPVKTLREFAEHAKKQPGELTYATLGPSTTLNLGMLLFMQRTGTRLREIPYKSSAQIYLDMAAGRVDFVLDNLANALPLIQTARVRPLAVTSTRRMEIVPDVPTVAEALLPGFKLTSWVGLAAPSGTPPEILARMSTALTKAMESTEYQAWLRTAGAQAPEATDPKSFSDLISQDLKLWRSAVELSGVKAPK